MTESGLEKLPKAVKEIVSEHHQDGVTESDCMACSSACCSQGRFAILENVIQIYGAYQRGALTREDYQFENALSLGRLNICPVAQQMEWRWNRQTIPITATTIFGKWKASYASSKTVGSPTIFTTRIRRRMPGLDDYFRESSVA